MKVILFQRYFELGNHEITHMEQGKVSEFLRIKQEVVGHKVNYEQREKMFPFELYRNNIHVALFKRKDKDANQQV